MMPRGSHCFIFIAIVAAASGAVAGCAGDTAVAHGQSASLAGDDLLRMTDDMAAKIVASPEVRRAIAREGTLRIVVEPVENDMTAEVLPSGAAHAFTGRLRTLLSERDRDRFTWIMNRDAWHYLRNHELDRVDPGPAPEAIQPRYALTAKFSTLSKEDANLRSIYYLCVYQLTDIEHRDVLWTDAYHVRKTIVKGFLD
jgi:hypothetical protein